MVSRDNTVTKLTRRKGTSLLWCTALPHDCNHLAVVHGSKNLSRLLYRLLTCGGWYSRHIFIDSLLLLISDHIVVSPIYASHVVKIMNDIHITGLKFLSSHQTMQSVL